MENPIKIGTFVENQGVSIDRRVCVAPMMDWTDRHCRYFHRLFAPHALLYTEMIVSEAIVRGNAGRLLEHDPREHPVALQLGGCDPGELAKAARVGAAAGYAEINLNVGCPSERVKNGAFGACLMLEPALVAACVRSMREVVSVPVTVKCRIGIDDRDSYEFFAEFVETVAAAGVDALIVHARAAILGGLTRPGLSPKENREIPPLKYAYVHRLKAERPELPLVINGGFTDCPSVLAQLAGAGARLEGKAGARLEGEADTRLEGEAGIGLAGNAAVGLDGVMLGRAAYHNPGLLAELERAVINPEWCIPSPHEVIHAMVSYARGQAARGVRLHSITRHMHGLMAGRAGARAWRRFLSDVAAKPGASPETLFSALPLVNQPLAA